MCKKNCDFSLVFVILHYLAVNETIDAVNHIKNNIDTDDYYIIIVDNGSTNKSFDCLKEKYNDETDIRLIHSDINLGFAGGNNLGYRYAKQYFNPKFIVLMNNDVNLIETHFYEKLMLEYRKSNFALAGPAILSSENECVKSIPAWQREFPTLEYCNYRINDMRERIFWCYFGVYRKASPFLRRTLWKWMGLFKNPGTPVAGIPKEDNIDSLETIYDTVIHGCFLVFSKSYIDLFDDGLDDRTFLYGEERILFVRVLSQKLRTAYIPKIKVVHLGGRSSNKKKQLKNRDYLSRFKSDLLSYKISKEYLLKFKNKYGIELQDWWKSIYS